MNRSTVHVRKNGFRILGTAGLMLLIPCLGAGCVGTDTESERDDEASAALENGSVYTPTGVYAGIGRVTSANGACTGTLISNLAVLTAGHCVPDGQPATFTLTSGRGSIDGTAVQHPLYNDLHWMGYDFAIIRFPHSIFDDPNVDSTGLVPFPVSDDTIQPNTPLDWYGMGNYGNDCADWTSMTVTRYQGVSFTSLQDDWQYVLNSTTTGLCAADSGGPVISNGEVVAVNSWRDGGGASYVKPTYMVYTWIRENAGRPELPGDTWGHCVHYPGGIGPSYWSTQGNTSAFTGTWDNSISSVWVEKGYRATLFDGTSYGGAQLGSYNGFLGATGDCDEFGCFYDLAGTSADNKASSAKCESELPGDTWGYCVLYHRYSSGNYLSIQSNLSNFNAYPEWKNSAAQIWVKQGHHAQVFPFESYLGGTADPNGSAPYWSSVTLDGSTGEYCNSYGCLHDLTGTVGERTASSIKCW